MEKRENGRKGYVYLKSGSDQPDFSKCDEVGTAMMRVGLKQGQSLGTEINFVDAEHH